ncbi:hypothetical protein R3P38DRAFT_276181 [Favolaschia claudopus]|uniref:Uncharacterized protein n=1 Tax=Favolaschia claudopus TaxID=2862362 RepID=A0AAV9ZQR9_9AGAR
MAAQAQETALLLQELYALVEGQSVVAAAALVVHGVFLLLFVLALYFLAHNHARGQRVLLFAAILLAGFAIVQVALDVALAGLPATALRRILKEGMTRDVMSMMEAFASMYRMRQGTLATNNAIADGLLLYRCYLIWAGSRYERFIIAVPSILIIITAAIAYATIYRTWDIRIPFGLALFTNLILFGLIAFRIWYKRRQAGVYLKQNAQVQRRYTASLEILLESGLLYVAAVLIYLISMSSGKVVPPFNTFQNICWGSLAQLVNIVPTLILVRVALVKRAASDAAAEKEGASVAEWKQMRSQGQESV